MRSDTVLVFFVIAIVTLALVHNLALIFHLYFYYPYIDIPMHFLGGASVALGFHTDLFRRYAKYFPQTLLHTVAVVVAVGVLWEVFEWYFGLVDSVGYAADTAGDLIMDTLGGITGYFVAHSVRSNL